MIWPYQFHATKVYAVFFLMFGFFNQQPTPTQEVTQAKAFTEIQRVASELCLIYSETHQIFLESVKTYEQLDKSSSKTAYLELARPIFKHLLQRISPYYSVEAEIIHSPEFEGFRMDFQPYIADINNLTEVIDSDLQLIFRGGGPTLHLSGSLTSRANKIDEALNTIVANHGKAPCELVEPAE